jgi:glycosyltransferase involved in cell wall biosynthesis
MNCLGGWTMSDKLVSVIIPTYKRSDCLPNAIKSVLNQTYKDIEIIVVDDNDPESEYRKNTEKVMEGFSQYSNVIYIKHDINRNGSVARNTGFKNSHGDYIMYLDDDDEFLPNKVEAQVRCLENLDDSWGLCYTNFMRKFKGKVLDYSCEKREGRLFTDALMRNLFIQPGSNLMIRRSVVEEMNGFDETFIRNQDLEFLNRILYKYKIAHVDILGLVVNLPTTQYRKCDFEEINNYYIDRFKPFVELLSDEDKKKFYKMTNLHLFRYYLTYSGYRKKAIKMIKDKEISSVLAFRYILHLLNRRLRGKIYGFNI